MLQPMVRPGTTDHLRELLDECADRLHRPRCAPGRKGVVGEPCRTSLSEQWVVDEAPAHVIDERVRRLLAHRPWFVVDQLVAQPNHMNDIVIGATSSIGGITADQESGHPVLRERLGHVVVSPVHGKSVDRIRRQSPDCARLAIKSILERLIDERFQKRHRLHHRPHHVGTVLQEDARMTSVVTLEVSGETSEMLGSSEVLRRVVGADCGTDAADQACRRRNTSRRTDVRTHRSTFPRLYRQIRSGRTCWPRTATRATSRHVIRSMPGPSLAAGRRES